MADYWPLLAIAAVVLFFALRGKDSKPPALWHLDQWSKGETLTQQGEGCAFSLPAQGDGSVGYVGKRTGPLVAGQTVTARGRITGTGFTAHEFPDRVPLVSMFIQRKGDDWQASDVTRGYRWYSKQTVTLEAGEFVLSAPLDVSAWGDVMGGRDAAAFAAALRDAESIGICLGSAGGRGHGVFATGGRVVVVLSLTDGPI